MVSTTGAERLSLGFQPVAKTGAALFLWAAAVSQTRRCASAQIRLFVIAYPQAFGSWRQASLLKDASPAGPSCRRDSILTDIIGGYTIKRLAGGPHGAHDPREDKAAEPG